jgi:hypothetical protein
VSGCALPDHEPLKAEVICRDIENPVIRSSYSCTTFGGIDRRSGDKLDR